MDLDESVAALAETQAGAIRRDQVRNLGATKGALRHRLARGSLIRVTSKVLRIRGTPATEEHRAWVAILDAGCTAVLSHHSAAAWWGLPGFELEPFHVARPRREPRRPTGVAIAHQATMLPARHITALRGVPIVTPSLLMLQLAAVVHPKKLARTLDTAWARRLVSGPSVREVLDDVGGRGKEGTAALRGVMAERPQDYRPPDSNQEARFQDLVRRVGIRMRRQIDVGGDEWLGRMDFIHERLPLIVQIDSELHHTALIDAEADERQTEQLTAAGFIVRRFSDFQLWYRADEMIAELETAVYLASRRALQHPA